jgi:hypothetical protein
MLPFLTIPWALLGLLAVPALVAIYWLRNRFRRVPVSSLMFWLEQKELRAGGLRVRRLQTPLLFFLELAALLFLIGAATGPSTSHATSARPLVVVLDDSYSMRAGGQDSARQRGAAALLEELKAGVFSVRFVLAQESAQVIGELARSAKEAARILDGWKCQAPAARLEEALALAGQLAGERGVMLVLSDHAPTFEVDKGRLRWWSFGQPRPNLAFVNAARSARGGQIRCLLEVANLSTAAQRSRLVVKDEDGAVVHESAVMLPPWETRTFNLLLKEDTPILHAHLDDDDLPIDNHVVLLREDRPPVRVHVPIRDGSLREHVAKALAATGKTVLTDVLPDMVFADRAESEVTRPDAWLVHFMAEKDAEAYLGPFVLDRTHPLTEGLSLQGIVWGAGKSQTVSGQPIILAGSVALVTDAATLGRHEVRLQFRQDLSTLQDSPQWPILISNLVHWRAARAPGVQRRNYRLGETVVVNVAHGVESVRILPPDGVAQQVPVHALQVMATTDQVGLYKLQAGERTDQLAVNTLNRDESDLSSCVTGKWGAWTDEAGQLLETQNFAWMLLLLAAAILTLHLFLVVRGKNP